LPILSDLRPCCVFVDAEYYRDVESGFEGLEMALNKIVAILYIIDIYYDTVIYENRGVRVENCIYSDKQIATRSIKTKIYLTVSFFRVESMIF
jgi:hypothetical protein